MRKRVTLKDLVRDQARAVGHKAAEASDVVFEKAMRAGKNFTSAHQAKLLITGFMQGKLEAADFAAALAEDDKLRFTVSDLCRMRLAAPQADVQRRNVRFDVIAGAKTFWNEMKVPVPSERDAMRDARNIAIGVMAGRGELAYQKPEKKTLKDALRDAKEKTGQILEGAREKAGAAAQKAAKIAVDKLKPIAGENGYLSEDAAAEFLKTEEGKAYQAAYTEEGAGQILDLVESLGMEQGTSGLSKKELEASLDLAGFYEDVAKEMEHGKELFTDRDVADMKAAETEVYEAEDDRWGQLFSQAVEELGENEPEQMAR